MKELYGYRKVFCIIPARGGSQGLPRKNVLEIAGKPLILHSIDIAKKIKYIDKIFVSTDNREIKEISLRNNVAVIDRPPLLATDTANVLDAIKHAITKINEENVIIVLFFPTSPYRQVKDMEKCIEMYDENVDCVVSITEVKEHTAWLCTKKNDLLEFLQKGNHVPNRQQQKDIIYHMTGSIIVTNSTFLQKQVDTFVGGKIKGFLLDEKYSLDIDTKFDFDVCKFVLESFE